jgi:hypothetical protein
MKITRYASGSIHGRPRDSCRTGSETRQPPGPIGRFETLSPPA